MSVIVQLEDVLLVSQHFDQYVRSLPAPSDNIKSDPEEAQNSSAFVREQCTSF